MTDASRLPKPDVAHAAHLLRGRPTCLAILAGVATVLADRDPAAGGDCPGAPEVCAPEILVLEGDAAPGTGSVFQSFDRPNLGPDGVVAFTGDTNGSTASDDVVYVGTMLIAREGDPAPGIAGATLGSFAFFDTSQQLNAGGGLAYIANLVDGPDGAGRAIYQDGALVVREGDAAAGAPGRLYQDFAYVGLTDDGRVGFLADLDGSTGSDSVIELDGEVLYREGDSVPGLPDLVWDGNFDEVQWNGRGDCLFEGNTSRPATMDMVLMIRRHAGDEVVELIVAEEGQVVTTGAGSGTLSSVQQNALAESGLWAFRGVLDDVPAEADSFLLAESGFSCREGDPVDELPGVVLGNLTGLSVNSFGEVLFLADLEGAAPAGVDEGLFLDRCLLVTDGSPVPGLPAGTTFSDIGFEDLQLNDDRQVVFQASYSGTVSGDGLFLIDCARCDEDVDADGDVDVDDLVVVLLAWGTAGSTTADVNGDGLVDVDDLAAVLTAWGTCPPNGG